MSVADSHTYRRLRWLLGIVLVAVVAVPSAPWLLSRAQATTGVTDATRTGAAAWPADAVRAAGPGATSTERLSITAPGHIEPQQGVLTIAAPSSLELGPAIVTELHVHLGDWVKAGQPLATLRGHDELAAALVSAERKVAVAQARVLALQAGGKQDDIRALHAEVLSEAASLAQAKADTRRTQQLRDARIISLAALESQESRLTVAEQSLEAKRARLSSLSTVRPADVAVAEAELRAAEADAEQARAKLESTVVRAPGDGRILAIHTYPGQSVGTEGLLAFGRTAEMFVDAEVMEEDFGRARVGQQARITSDAFSGVAVGSVEELGYIVGSREVFKTDPTAFTDSRVVHVKIRLLDPKKFERLINARVTVEIRQ